MANMFASGLDDFMFPTTREGMRESGMILESAAPSCENKRGEFGVVENAVDDDAITSARASAMSAVLSWIEDGDFSYNSLDETVIVVADIDGDYELTEEEEAYYSNIWDQIPDALLTLGAKPNDVQEFVNGPTDAADNAAARMGKMLAEKMETEESDDDSLIAGFAFGEDAILESAAYDEVLHGILEATYKKAKVVRNGEIQTVKKRVSGKARLSAAAKAGLRKARRKAHTATANLARRKSLKVRKNHGM